MTKSNGALIVLCLMGAPGICGVTVIEGEEAARILRQERATAQKRARVSPRKKRKKQCQKMD